MKKSADVLAKNSGTEEKRKKNTSPLYTIMDRYQNLCRQANLRTGEFELDEKYLERWFVY